MTGGAAAGESPAAETPRRAASAPKRLMRAAPLISHAPPRMTSRAGLFDVPITRLRDILVSLGEPAYRARQLYRAVLHERATSVGAISTLSAASRARIDDALALRAGRVAKETRAGDGVVKQLVELTGGGSGRSDAAALGLGAKEAAAPAAAAAARVVESVRIPEGRRETVCVSSQVGCSLACAFCHTGTQAMRGNASASEIIEQVLLSGARPTNVVFMGMGEPLLNYRAVLGAIGVLTDARDGLALPARRVLVSTAGIAPVIARLATDAPGVRLALSLHAPSDALRTRLIGVNARFPLRDTLAACAQFVDASLARLVGGGATAADDDNDESGDDDEGGSGAEPRGQRFNGPRRVRVSFEYVLLSGVNDAREDAAALAALLSAWHPRARLHAHVNAIPFNAWPGAPFSAPTAARVAAFVGTLRDAGFAATVRRPRGDDALAACGQLRASADAKRPAVALRA